MDQSMHFITVSTADLDAGRSFYITGLDWHPLMDVPGEIIFFQVAPGLVLGLFDSEKFNADIATGADYSTVSGLTLSHNVESHEAVHTVVDAMQRAGGTSSRLHRPARSAVSTTHTCRIPTASSGRSPTTPRGASTTMAR